MGFLMKAFFTNHGPSSTARMSLNRSRPKAWYRCHKDSKGSIFFATQVTEVIVSPLCIHNSKWSSNGLKTLKNDQKGACKPEPEVFLSWPWLLSAKPMHAMQATNLSNLGRRLGASQAASIYRRIERHPGQSKTSSQNNYAMSRKCCKPMNTAWFTFALLGCKEFRNQAPVSSSLASAVIIAM